MEVRPELLSARDLSSTPQHLNFHSSSARFRSKAPLVLSLLSFLSFHPFKAVGQEIPAEKNSLLPSLKAESVASSACFEPKTWVVLKSVTKLIFLTKMN